MEPTQLQKKPKKVCWPVLSSALTCSCRSRHALQTSLKAATRKQLHPRSVFVAVCSFSSHVRLIASELLVPSLRSCRCLNRRPRLLPSKTRFVSFLCHSDANSVAMPQKPAEQKRGARTGAARRRAPTKKHRGDSPSCIARSNPHSSAWPCRVAWAGSDGDQLAEAQQLASDALASLDKPLPDDDSEAGLPHSFSKLPLSNEAPEGLSNRSLCSVQACFQVLKCLEGAKLPSKTC